jgi:hypothetical protein
MPAAVFNPQATDEPQMLRDGWRIWSARSKAHMTCERAGCRNFPSRGTRNLD